MGKMDPGPEEKWSGQNSAGKEAPDAGRQNQPAKDNIVRQSNPDGKGLNPGQKGPAQPSGIPGKADDAG